MLLYNPNDSNIYSKEYREERNKILMNRMLKLHIQKLQLLKWEHGKPVELAADDFSYFIKYEDGSIYIVYIVSQALGHNRLDTSITSYLK